MTNLAPEQARSAIEAQIVARNLPPVFKEDVSALWKYALNQFPPDKVQWSAPIEQVSTEGGLQSVVHPTDSAPALTISALAVHDGGKSKEVPLPLAFDTDAVLGENALRDYEIRRTVEKKTGKVDRHAPLPLDGHIAKLLQDDVENPAGIVGKIPVYKVMAFWPAPQDRGSHEINLVPTITAETTHAHYLVIQDKALGVGQVNNPYKTRILTDHKDDNSKPLISATYVPDLNDIERLIASPEQNSGHLVIVSLPFKDPPPRPSPGRYFAFNDLGLGPRTRSLRGGVNVGETALGQGADSGIKTTWVKLDYDPTNTPVIYHVVTLGVQRNTIDRLTPEVVTQAFDAMNN